MKNFFFGVMLILLIQTPARAQEIHDSLRNETLKAIFLAAVTADTLCLGSSYIHSENWEKIVIDSTTIMWAEDMAKIWPDQDNKGGYTFIKRGGVWLLLDKKDAETFNLIKLLTVLQKLRACMN